MKPIVLVFSLVSTQVLAHHDHGKPIYTDDGKPIGHIIVSNNDSDKYTRHHVQYGRLVKEETCSHKSKSCEVKSSQ